MRQASIETVWTITHTDKHATSKYHYVMGCHLWKHHQADIMIVLNTNSKRGHENWDRNMRGAEGPHNGSVCCIHRVVCANKIKEPLE